MSHEGKAAIVTGGARGIGRAIALRLARAGADVAIIDIELDGARHWNEKLTAATVPDEIRALGRRSAGVQADLSKRASAAAGIAQAVEALGRADILVNAAGGAFTPLETSHASNTTDADMEVLFAINYAGLVYCCQEVIPALRAQKGGAIVNISSQAASHPAANGGFAHYGAAKAAVNNYTRALAGELGPDQIRVNAVLPGYTMSSRAATMAASRGVGQAVADTFPLRRFGQPDDIAKAVEFLSGDMSEFITGQCLAVNGGASLSAT